MPALTAAVVRAHPTYLDALNDRTLSLRGLRLTILENLGALPDIATVRCLDVADNLLNDLDLPPRLLHDVEVLQATRNRLHGVPIDIAKSLPRLRVVDLSSNAIADVNAVEGLVKLRYLEMVHLDGNPLAVDAGGVSDDGRALTDTEICRLWLIWRLPLKVRFVDFERVRQREREEGERLFGPRLRQHRTLGELVVAVADEYAAKRARRGESMPAADALRAMTPLARQIAHIREATDGDGNKTYTLDATVASPVQRKTTPKAGLSAADRDRIRLAITHAKSIAEIQELEQCLREGRLP